MPPDRFHLCGVAGVGMSALAEVLVRRGHTVSGSDRFFDQGAQAEIAAILRAQGVRLLPEDGSGVRPDLRALVVSAAIESDHPDVMAAGRLGVPILGRAQCLAEEVRGGRCVAVSGTSGKSTVTAMVGWILSRAGADPWVVMGAALRGWRSAERLGSVRWGGSNWWTIEADESDQSLLVWEPEWAVVTNVSDDHFPAAEARELFNRFLARARQGALDFSTPSELWDGFEPVPEEDGTRLVYRGQTIFVPLPGRHNAENAWCSVVLADHLGVPLHVAAEALETFPGLHRRLEVLGDVAGVTVVDDYAHNPAKLRAAWEAMKARGGRVHAIWRPHGFGPLRKMFGELATLFAAWSRTGQVWILPVFDAGGTADRTIHAPDLVAAIQRAGGHAEALSDFDACRARVVQSVRSGDVVLVMGARDPALPELGRLLLRDLAARSPQSEKHRSPHQTPQRHGPVDQQGDRHRRFRSDPNEPQIGDRRVFPEAQPPRRHGKGSHQVDGGADPQDFHGA